MLRSTAVSSDEFVKNNDEEGMEKNNQKECGVVKVTKYVGEGKEKM